MSSVKKIQNFEKDEVQLNSGSNALTVTPSGSMIETFPFIYPPDTGGTETYLETYGNGETVWGSFTEEVPDQFPPEANPGLFRGRTNEDISIDLSTISKGGGTLSTVLYPITTYTIVTSVNFGTLTNTGLGTYTYKSFPRFLGIDYFSFTVTDSDGKDSTSLGSVRISIERVSPRQLAASGPDKSGPFHIYATGRNIRQLIISGGNESDTLLKSDAASIFPSGNRQLNALATNREDNIVYFCQNNGPTSLNGRIYGWDYVNDILFLLVDAKADNVHFPYPNDEMEWQTNGSFYHRKAIYIGAEGDGCEYLYRISTSPYDPDAGTKQSVVSVTRIDHGSCNGYGDIAWDYSGNNIVLSISNTAFDIIDPLSGFRHRRTSLSRNYQITNGDDNNVYGTRSRNIEKFNIYTGGTTSTGYTHSLTPTDMAEWICQPL